MIIYGINAPGAASFRPLAKFSRQTDAILNLFMGGLEKLCITSTPSCGLPVGLGGLLISRSFFACGDWDPEGRAALPESLRGPSEIIQSALLIIHMLHHRICTSASLSILLTSLDIWSNVSTTAKQLKDARKKVRHLPPHLANYEHLSFEK